MTRGARPALWRDPWAWLSVLAVAPLLLHLRGAPLGIPVADDFDYLWRVALSGQHTLFDGCGSIFYWRPLGRQIYFEVFWRVMLSAPAIVAWLHAGLLATSSLVLFRAFRVALARERETTPHWHGGLVASAVASFTLFAESARMLITWPSNFQDLGAILFASVAIHEAVHRRIGATLAALLLSLFCKEAAVLAALLIPFMPGLGGPGADAARDRLRERFRWAAWTASLVAAWGVVYVAVSRSAGLRLPAQLEPDPVVAATPLLERFIWALWNSVRSAWSLPAIHAPGERMLWLASLAVFTAALGMLVWNPGARRRLRARAGWILWGGAWFLAASATLLAIFPTWAAYRGLFSIVGLGVASIMLLGAAHPVLAGAFVIVRLVAFAASPAPPAGVSGAAFVTGAAVDLPNLVRLQRLVLETRELLQSEFPTLPPGSAIVQHHLPLGTEWAYVGDRALQVWYADTTLRWVRFDAFRADTSLQAVTIVEYQSDAARMSGAKEPGPPILALVEPEAMRMLLAAESPMRAGNWPEALRVLERAEALQRDPGAGVFLGTVIGKRALAEAERGDAVRAEREALRALAAWSENPDSRYVLAYLAEREGRLAEAEAQLDTLLTSYPGDAGANAMRERVRALRSANP